MNATLAWSPILIQKIEIHALGFQLVQLAFDDFPQTDDLKLLADTVAPHFA